jgi:hypothetical protein
MGCFYCDKPVRGRACCPLLRNRRLGEELLDDLAQLRNVLRRIDGHAQVRPVVEALGVPGVQRPKFVDDPPLAPAGRYRLTRALARRDMPEPLRFVYALGDEQVDVLEEKPRAIRGCHLARLSPFGEVAGLLEDPWVPERTAAHEDAGDRSGPDAIDEL